MTVNDIRNRELKDKIKGKEYADGKRGAVKPDLEIKKEVLLKPEKTN